MVLVSWKQRALAVALCLLTAGIFAGCQDKAPVKESRKAVSSMKETYDYLGRAMNELEGVRSLLDRLPTTNDLPGWYKDYTSRVAEMAEAGNRARDRWQDMKARGQEYIAKWEQEAAAVQDPQVKETMEQRKQRVTAGYESAIAIAQELRDSYQPYYAELQALQKALKVDLTPANVKALGPSIEKAKANGATVAAKLDALGKELDKLSGRMSAKPAGT